jgi:molybdopterin-guanine dinucleotide biosynthesis protein A
LVIKSLHKRVGKLTQDPQIPVYVLVGGASQRFGADKATTLVDGEPWALHVGRRLAAPGAEIVLVGTTLPDAFASYRGIDDAKGVLGPLAGILAALNDRCDNYGEGLLALASCDLVRPVRGWLGPLEKCFADAKSLNVAAYRAADRWQPFPCVAHTRWLTPLSEQVAAGTRSLQAALDGSNVAAVQWGGAADGPPQANSPAELQIQLTCEPGDVSPRSWGLHSLPSGS